MPLWLHTPFRLYLRAVLCRPWYLLSWVLRDICHVFGWRLDPSCLLLRADGFATSQREGFLARARLGTSSRPRPLTLCCTPRWSLLLIQNGLRLIPFLIWERLVCIDHVGFIWIELRSLLVFHWRLSLLLNWLSLRCSTLNNFCFFSFKFEESRINVFGRFALHYG